MKSGQPVWYGYRTSRIAAVQNGWTSVTQALPWDAHPAASWYLQYARQFDFGEHGSAWMLSFKIELYLFLKGITPLLPGSLHILRHNGFGGTKRNPVWCGRALWRWLTSGFQ